MMVELKHDTGVPGSNVGAPSGSTACALERYSVNDLPPGTNSLTISEAKLFISSNSGLKPGDPITILIGSIPHGDPNIDDAQLQNMAAHVQLVGGFTAIPFPASPSLQQVTITPNIDALIGMRISDSPGINPATQDQGPPVGFSYYGPGCASYKPITTYGDQSNWMFRALGTLPACSVTLDQNERSFDTLGRSVAVLTGHSQCKPSVTSNASWVTIRGVGVFSGGFSVEYSVEPTPFSDPRTTTIDIGDKVFTVHQAGSKPLPSITLSPNSIPAGGSGFRLTANGTGFTSNSILGWNGEGRATTLVGGTQLSAEIPAADIATPGMARVTVFDVSLGGGTSPPVTFTIDPVPDFSLGFDQSTVNAQAGTKARVTVNINRAGGFTGNVTVTPPDPAGGIKPRPADPITTTDTTATFKLKIGAGAAPGPHQLTFTGKDDSGRTHTATITLVVK